MRYFKNLSVACVFLLGLTFLITPNTSDAKDELGGHICCQASSTGCVDILGNPWPDDETRTTETCTITIEED